MSSTRKGAGRRVLVSTLVAVLVAAAWAAWPAGARASVIGDICIDVWDAGKAHHGQQKFTIPESLLCVKAGKWKWDADLGAVGLAVRDAENHILATINSLSVSIEEDPAVSLTYSMTAGSSDILFNIASPLVAFGTILHPQAFATAGITVTDNDSNGATATGLFAGGKAYEARFDGVAWANLIGNVTAGTDNSNTASDRRPGAAREAVPVSVSTMQSEFKFTLSANDSAGVTSRFDVVPEPATLALLGAGLGVMLFRRRGR